MRAGPFGGFDEKAADLNTRSALAEKPISVRSTSEAYVEQQSSVKQILLCQSDETQCPLRQPVLLGRGYGPVSCLPLFLTFGFTIAYF